MRHPTLPAMALTIISLPLIATTGCFGPSGLMGDQATDRAPTSTKTPSELVPGDFVGKPTVDRSRPGLYLYHDSARWNLLAQGGETSEKHIGVITSNASLSEVEALQFESDDVFSKADTRVNYTMVVRGGQDRIVFQRPSAPIEVERTLLLFTPFTDFTGQNVLSFSHEPKYEVEKGEVYLLLRPSSLSGRQALLSKDGSSYKTGGHLIVYLQDDRVVVRMQDTAHDYQIESPPGLLTVGQFAVIKLAFGQGGMQLFVSNQLVASHPYAGGLSGNRQPLVVGASNWSDSGLRDYFHGTLMAYFLDATPRFVEPTTRLNISSLSAQKRVYVGKNRVAVDTTSLVIPALSAVSADAAVGPEPDAGLPVEPDAAPGPDAALPLDSAPAVATDMGSLQSAELVFNSGFESGTLEEDKFHYNFYGLGSHSTRKIVTAPTREGRFALQSTILGNEHPVKERVEILPRQGNRNVIPILWDGPEYWVAFSLYVPTNHQHSDVWYYSQLHSIDAPLLESLGGCKTPANAMGIRPSKTNAEAFGIMALEDGTKNPGGSHGASGHSRFVADAPMVRDTWVDWVIHVKLSTKQEGLFEVWKDGKKIYEKFNVTNVQVWDSCGNYIPDYVPKEKLKHYFTFGMYGNNNPTFRRVYLDAFKVAQGPNGYRQVAP